MAENISILWLLTLDYFKKDIKKAEDNLIILVHWLLLKNNFLALGPGNENVIDENEKPTDFLPIKWSEDETYKLRYVHQNDLFLLNGVKAGDSFIINFYDVTTRHVTSVALGNICTTVQLINNVSNNKDDFFETVNMLQINLVNPMHKEYNNKQKANPQISSMEYENSSETPLFISKREPNNYTPSIPRNPFPSYGIPDLGPLAGLRNHGGGMIFDPTRVVNGRSIEYPWVPPMAHLDQMQLLSPNSLMPGGYRRPNPDNIRQLEFYDDMK